MLLIEISDKNVATCRETILCVFKAKFKLEIAVVTLSC